MGTEKCLYCGKVRCFNRNCEHYYLNYKEKEITLIDSQDWWWIKYERIHK